MKRSVLHSSAELISRSFDDNSTAVRFVVGIDGLAALTFEVGLLLFGLSDRLSIRLVDGASLSLRVGADDRGEMDEVGRHTSVALSRRQVELALEFLLRYQRDGYAEVRHLDIELGIDSSTTLVLEARDFLAPMSGAEARRLLELDE